VFIKELDIKMNDNDDKLVVHMEHDNELREKGGDIKASQRTNREIMDKSVRDKEINVNMGNIQLLGIKGVDRLKIIFVVKNEIFKSGNSLPYKLYHELSELSWDSEIVEIDSFGKYGASYLDDGKKCVVLFLFGLSVKEVSRFSGYSYIVQYVTNYQAGKLKKIGGKHLFLTRKNCEDSDYSLDKNGIVDIVESFV
jgi:hypothetical protein